MELSSERKQPEVDLNRWPLWCPAAAQLAGSQPESKDKEWTELKAERVDLSVRGVHRSLSKTLVVLAASPHDWRSKWLVHMNAARSHLSRKSDASVLR